MYLVLGSFYTSERHMQQKVDDNKQISYNFLKTPQCPLQWCYSWLTPSVPNISSNAKQSFPSWFHESSIWMGSLAQETKRQYKKTFANPMLSHCSPDQRRLSDRIIKISRLLQLNFRSLEGFFCSFQVKAEDTNTTLLVLEAITISRVATVWIKNYKPEPQNFMHSCKSPYGPLYSFPLLHFNVLQLKWNSLFFVLQLRLLACKMSHQCMCSLQNAKWTVPWREGQETEMLVGKRAWNWDRHLCSLSALKHHTEKSTVNL